MSAVLVLRKATKEDAETLWHWTNDPDVRRNSLNVAAIDWDSHKVWLQKKLASADCLLLMGELGDVPVGMVRFDKRGLEATISISVAEAHRGRGLGKCVLASGMDFVLQTWALREFRAYVKPENAGSVALFEGLGFKNLELADLGVCKAWLFVLPISSAAEVIR